MINLIPNQEKKKMARNFYLRLAAVLFGVLGISILMVSITLVPSYFNSGIERNLAEEKLAEQKAQPIPNLDQQTLSDLAALDKKLSVIEKAEQVRYLLTKSVIAEVVSKKMSDIKINRISYSNTAQAGQKIIVEGQAPSRERLLAFTQTLEGDSLFQKVDIPVSNFIQGQNIKFSITLTPS